MATEETSCKRKSCCSSACTPPQHPVINEVPLLDLQDTTLLSRSAFQDAYDGHQVLHIRGYKPNHLSNENDDFFRADHVKDLFDSLGEQDKASWCIENKKNHKSDDEDGAKRGSFLQNNKKGRGYCSFLVQHSKDVLDDLLTSSLPMVHLPVQKSNYSKDGDTAAVMKVDYGPALWMFFGKNYNSNEALLGRPEHTDSVTHDGTFHYQLSGTKIWRLRPTAELMEAMASREQSQSSSTTNKKRKVEEIESNKEANNPQIEVECREGDILLLNTRLWWHSTIIPSQDVPCISYARDIYFTQQQDDAAQEEKPDRESSMTNVDGTYAAEAIEADTILFTERNMPDIELPRSKSDPNCQVVELEDEDGGTFMAVVTLREIKEGEFFCLMESDDEEESGDEGLCQEDWEEEEDVKNGNMVNLTLG